MSESTSSSSDAPSFEPRRYVRWLTARAPRWIMLDGRPAPDYWPDHRNWTLLSADAMNERWDKPDPRWALERAAADAEVEADEMTGRVCVHRECNDKYGDGACWYAPDDPRRWLPRKDDY